MENSHMPTTAAQREAMIEVLSADQFAPLDLSAFPSLQEQPAPDEHDDRWSRDWRDTPLNASAHALRSFVSDPDVEALDRVGSETGHPGFRAEVRQRRGEKVAETFKRENPSYVPTPENYDLIVQTLAFNALPSADQEGSVDEVVAILIERGFWTPGNLGACFRALTAEGLLTVAAGATRNLSSSERLRVTRMAQAGNIDGAIEEYLKCSLDGEELDPEIAYDPAYRDACDAAVWAVFKDITNDFVFTPEREAYMNRHCAGRPVTLALLQSAWSACQAASQRYDRSEALRPLRQREERAPTQQELEAMDDGQVDDLYHKSLRAYAQAARRPNGVLA
jgi:hypothetical protein